MAGSLHSVRADLEAALRRQAELMAELAVVNSTVTVLRRRLTAEVGRSLAVDGSLNVKAQPEEKGDVQARPEEKVDVKAKPEEKEDVKAQPEEMVDIKAEPVEPDPGAQRSPAVRCGTRTPFCRRCHYKDIGRPGGPRHTYKDGCVHAGAEPNPKRGRPRAAKTSDSGSD